MSAGEDHLAGLAGVLDQLKQLLRLGRPRYDAEAVTRFAIERLWIAAGECARRYCDATGTDNGVEPWSSLWAYRNFLAHHLPDEISNERVWLESLRDLSEYEAALREMREEK